MITYGVTLYPLAETPLQDIDELLEDIQLLVGSIPGLLRVDIHSYNPQARQDSYSYTMYFDAEEHLQIFTAHLSYQSIRTRLNQISPKTIVTGLLIRETKLTIRTSGDE